jgi:hypothetical protein
MQQSLGILLRGVDLAVLIGANAQATHERTPETIHIGVPNLIGQTLEGYIGAVEQLAGSVDARPFNEFGWGLAGVSLEYPGEIAFAHAHVSGQ